MNLFSPETKDNLRLGWLSMQEALYTFAPWQRVVLVFGIIMIIPAYWIFRVGAKTIYSQSYKKYHVAATPSFTDPQPLQLGAVAILPVTGGGYTAYAKVANPNLKLSGTFARYVAKFTGQTGQQVYQTNGQFYVSPGKETYIIIPRFAPAEPVVAGTLEIADVKWQQKFQVPEINLSVPAPTAFEEPGGTRIEGIVVNNSPYKIGAVRIVVFLYDAAGKVVGVSDRSEFTVLPRERRAYVLQFKGVSPEDFSKIAAFPETNAADVANVQSLDDRLQQQDLKPKR